MTTHQWKTNEEILFKWTDANRSRRSDIVNIRSFKKEPEKNHMRQSEGNVFTTPLRKDVSYFFHVDEAARARVVHYLYTFFLVTIFASPLTRKIEKMRYACAHSSLSGASLFLVCFCFIKAIWLTVSYQDFNKKKRILLVLLLFLSRSGRSDCDCENAILNKSVLLQYRTWLMKVWYHLIRCGDTFRLKLKGS